ncbi:hypothetical protein AKJ16_DCAP23033 [Drosera capensis]
MIFASFLAHHTLLPKASPFLCFAQKLVNREKDCEKKVVNLLCGRGESNGPSALIWWLEYWVVLGFSIFPINLSDYYLDLVKKRSELGGEDEGLMMMSVSDNPFRFQGLSVRAHIVEVIVWSLGMKWAIDSYKLYARFVLCWGRRW